MKTQCEVKRNVEKNGIELRFPGKPSEEIRVKMRSNGWKPSRFGGFWFWYKRYSPTNWDFALELCDKEGGGVVESSTNRLIRSTTLTKLGDVPKNIFKKEVEAGKILGVNYKYFDGTSDSVRSIRAVDLMWTDARNLKGLDYDYANKEPRNSIKYNEEKDEITFGYFKFKYKPEFSSTTTEPTHPKEKEYSLDQINKENYSYVTLDYDLGQLRDDDRWKSESLRSIFIVFEKSKIAAEKEVRNALDELIPMYSKYISINVFPKNYIRKSRELFDKGYYLSPDTKNDLFKYLTEDTEKFFPSNKKVSMEEETEGPDPIGKIFKLPEATEIFPEGTEVIVRESRGESRIFVEEMHPKNIVVSHGQEVPIDWLYGAVEPEEEDLTSDSQIQLVGEVFQMPKSTEVFEFGAEVRITYVEGGKWITVEETKPESIVVTLSEILPISFYYESRGKQEVLFETQEPTTLATMFGVTKGIEETGKAEDGWWEEEVSDFAPKKLHSPTELEKPPPLKDTANTEEKGEAYLIELDNKFYRKFLATLNDSYYEEVAIFSSLNEAATSVNFQSGESGWYKPKDIKIPDSEDIFFLRENGAILYWRKVKKNGGTFIVLEFTPNTSRITEEAFGEYVNKVIKFQKYAGNFIRIASRKTGTEKAKYLKYAKIMQRIVDNAA